MNELSEIDPMMFSAVCGLIGSILFLIMPNKSQSRSKWVVLADAIGLMLTGLFCGIGAYLYTKNMFSKPDDYLMPVGLMPMISGFVLPSILRGAGGLLRKFQTNPLGVAKALLDLWSKRK